MPPNLQVTKLHKKLKLRQYLLVSFGDLVFWWPKNSFRSILKVNKMKMQVSFGTDLKHTNYLF